MLTQTIGASASATCMFFSIPVYLMISVMIVTKSMYYCKEEEPKKLYIWLNLPPNYAHLPTSQANPSLYKGILS
jgi:hypothetical protein